MKTTNVSVNLNALLQQVKDGGIVAVYRCPHCGGPLKVGKDTNVESLRTCEHCGSEIEAVDLADFLRSALS
ncbi:phage terminase large subunit family protein [Candidatus Bathyarchaeota archaeon]|nr:phage terminase large subunit family protein [Candidatus Bathyarchaeota archaeon]